MKLFHGSPKKLKVLRPVLAKGIEGFENQKGVFLCKTFLHAALYAVGKTLKGKTIFAVMPKRLIIVGDFKPESGYVYSVDVKAKKGPREQFIFNGDISDFEVFKVEPKDYNKNIVYVENLNELKEMLR
jgi:hypothetical protein